MFEFVVLAPPFFGLGLVLGAVIYDRGYQQGRQSVVNDLTPRLNGQKPASRNLNGQLGRRVRPGGPPAA